MKRFDWLNLVYFAVVVPLSWCARLASPHRLRFKRGRTALSQWRDHCNRRLSRHQRKARRALEASPPRTSRYILGISAYYHDSAAALLKDGMIVAAAQEERFTRRKHDPSFPSHAVNYCLKEAGIHISDLALVVFYEDPALKFERLLGTFIQFAPHGRELFRAALPVWLGGKLNQRQMISDALTIGAGVAFRTECLQFTEHHLSHAASAYYPSPFCDAAILTVDGVGEYATTTIAVGEGDRLSLLKEIRFPHSLGLLYSAFTVYTGFVVNSGEYKLMGLAPYGKPTYAQLIREHLIDLKPDGSFELNMDYFEYGRALKTINSKFETLLGAPARKHNEPLTQRHMDLAASIQVVLQEAILSLARYVAKLTGKHNLCLAGGVALNCVANGHLLRSGLFKDIWIQPAAGDAGGALGAAYIGHIIYGKRPRAVVRNGTDAMSGSYLGPCYTPAEVREELGAAGAVVEEVNDDTLFDEVSSALAEGKAIGWFSGRMEFGPRSLGARSILADARSATMQRILNLKIKNRESFRPFAPAVLREDVSTWFELDVDSPYMLLVAQVKRGKCRSMTEEEMSLFGLDMLNVVRSTIPAVTHVDHSARVQTVHADRSPRFHRLIQEFKKKSEGTGVLVNTSFNVRGEPIVLRPGDAFRCLMGTELDLLVVENCLVRKDRQKVELKRSYLHEVPLD